MRRLPPRLPGERTEDTGWCRRRWPRFAAVVAVALLCTACGSSNSSSPQWYGPRPSHAAVRVDTPQLRQLRIAAGIQACPVSKQHPRPVSSGLPDVTLPCLGGGRAVHLAGLRGTPLVLNFWSQTCGPCRHESPIFQKVYAAARSRVDVVGVDWLDPRPSWAIAFADSLGLTYPQVADPQGVTRAPLRITTLPRTLFVDATGHVVYTEFAAVTSADQLRSLIKEHLGVTVPAVGAG
jgi:cytochrome c biogenesis protein CcmG, thiol:disulfide interchange protein DsbE